MVHVSVLGALLFLSPASTKINNQMIIASGITGNVLNDLCEKWQNADRLDPCSSYIMGLDDGLAVDRRICFPDNSSPRQAIYIVVKYLRDHPEKWGAHALGIAQAALKPVFPCGK